MAQRGRGVFKLLAITLLIALGGGVFILIGMSMGEQNAVVEGGGDTFVLTGDAMIVIVIVFLAIFVGGVVWAWLSGNL